MLKRRQRYGRLHLMTIVVIAYSFMLFVATHMPNDSLPDVVKSSDKVAHFVAYGLLAWLTAWVFSQKQALRLSGYLFVWGIAALYGLLDELLQMIPMFHRSADVKDWIADVTGAACALILFAGFSALRKGRGTSTTQDL